MFKRILFGTTWLLAGLLIGITGSNYAQQSILDGKTTFDLGVGESRYTRAPDQQWWQAEHQNSVRTVDNVQSIGFSFQANNDWTLGLHYASLGSMSIEAQAVTCPDDDCHGKRDTSKDFFRADCKPAMNQDNCAYRWTSGGNAKGALTTAAYRAFNMGALGFDLRGGLFFHQLKYSAVVENIECRDDPTCWRVAVTQKTHFAVRPVLGLGAKYQPAFLHGGFVAVTWDRFFGIGDRVNQMTAGFKGDTDRMMFWGGLPL
jgi:hypothetical protein